MASGCGGHHSIPTTKSPPVVASLTTWAAHDVICRPAIFAGCRLAMTCEQDLPAHHTAAARAGDDLDDLGLPLDGDPGDFARAFRSIASACVRQRGAGAVRQHAR
jgi:hypothetical protein